MSFSIRSVGILYGGRISGFVGVPTTASGDLEYPFFGEQVVGCYLQSDVFESAVGIVGFEPRLGRTLGGNTEELVHVAFAGQSGL